MSSAAGRGALNSKQFSDMSGLPALDYGGFMHCRCLGFQRAADDEEGRDQHRHGYQHKESTERGVDLIAQHDGVHIGQRFGWFDELTAVDTGGEFLRLRQKTNRGFLMENLLPARGH